jgi:hypothetical protein
VGVTLILMALGAGLGFASISHWPRSGVSAATFGAATAIWLVVVQWLSSGFGGYLAGRLRTRWVGLHPDESIFRDTAHGLLTWALATIMVVGILSLTAASLIGRTTRAAADMGAVEPQGVSDEGLPDAGVSLGQFLGIAYLTDELFHSSHPAGPPEDTRGEASRILLTAFHNGAITDADKAYLTQLVVADTGVDQVTAAKRVDDAIAQLQKAKADLKQKADAARKAASAASFATALSLLIGAFIGGVAAALGGRHRDEQPITLTP